MDVEELQQYVEENSGVKDAFMEHTLGHLKEVNNALAPARRENSAILQHRADRMYDDFIEDLYDKIMTGLKLHRDDSPEKLATVIEEAEILDNVEESIQDAEE
jgi:ClpP class serine protease